MGSKLRPGQFDCLRAAMPDEPMFILLARDPSAPAMLRRWAAQRRQDVLAVDHPGEEHPPEVEEDLRKCTEADACADEMIVWRRRNEGAWREGNERRVARTYPGEEQRAAVAEGVRRGIGAVAGIPSQSHGSITIVEHRARLWSSPSFNGARHDVAVRAVGRFEGVEDRTPRPADMPIDGQTVADVEVVHRDDDTITLVVMTVYEE